MKIKEEVQLKVKVRVESRLLTIKKKIMGGDQQACQRASPTPLATEGVLLIPPVRVIK